MLPEKFNSFLRPSCILGIQLLYFLFSIPQGKFAFTIVIRFEKLNLVILKLNVIKLRHISFKCSVIFQRTLV